MSFFRTNRRAMFRGLAIAAGMIVITAVAMLLGRARVSGGTPDERLDSIRGIVANGPFGAAWALSKAARQDPAAEVRAAALDGLARLGGGSAATFRTVSADPDPLVRAAATGALATIEKPWAVDRLSELAAGDDEEKVRGAAVAALGRCPASEAVVALIGLLDDTAAPDDARAAAARALRARCRIGAPVPGPGDGPAWDAAVDRYKADKVVRDAYIALGKPPPEHRPLPQPERMGE